MRESLDVSVADLMVMTIVYLVNHISGVSAEDHAVHAGMPTSRQQPFRPVGFAPVFHRHRCAGRQAVGSGWAARLDPAQTLPEQKKALNELLAEFHLGEYNSRVGARIAEVMEAIPASVRQLFEQIDASSKPYWKI